MKTHIEYVREIKSGNAREPFDPNEILDLFRNVWKRSLPEEYVSEHVKKDTRKLIIRRYKTLQDLLS